MSPNVTNPAVRTTDQVMMSLDQTYGDRIAPVAFITADQGSDAATIPDSRRSRRRSPQERPATTGTAAGGRRGPAALSRASTAAGLRDRNDAAVVAAPEQAEIFALLRSALTPAVAGRDPRPRPWTDASGWSPAYAGLSVYYQVMVDLVNGRLVGVEALARLRDDQGRMVPPAIFVPVAERTGLIGPLGRHVLETACADLAGWHTRHPAWRDLGVSVNLSAHQADLSDVAAEVQETLRRTGLAAAALTLELTETVMLDAGHAAVRVLRELRRQGVKLALDDFGTGHASLQHLAGLPMTSVKIDRSFTAGLPEDVTSVAIVRAVLGLAHELGLTCVVEGIETPAQRDHLTRHLRRGGSGAGREVIGQGFLLGQPLPAHAIESRYLHSQRPAQ